MKKYKVKNTSIMHNGSAVKEGGIIELSDEQAKKLADYIELIPEPEKAVLKVNTSETSDSSISDGSNDDGE